MSLLAPPTSERRTPRHEREAPQWVYFLRPVGEEGPVKIGVSEVPENRLRTYMVWSPMILEVAAKIEGDCVLERRFHNQFRHLHTHHEWFRAAPELSDAIEAIRRGAFDLECLPDPRKLGSPTRYRWTPRQRLQASLNRRLDRVLHVLGR